LDTVVFNMTRWNFSASISFLGEPLGVKYQPIALI